MAFHPAQLTVRLPPLCVHCIHLVLLFEKWVSVSTGPDTDGLYLPLHFGFFNCVYIRKILI